MKWKYSRQQFALAISLVLLIILFILHLAIGKVQIPWFDSLQILLTGESSQLGWRNIIWQFRLPKAITAALSGAALAVSGLQLQTLFQNPLAGPFTLGVSSGASLGVAIVVLTADLRQGPNFAQLGSWATVIASCIGSFIVTISILDTIGN